MELIGMSGLLAAGWMLLAAYVIVLLALSAILNAAHGVKSMFRSMWRIQPQEVDKQ